MDFSKKQILILISTYVVAHLLLLIVTGTWWDDWCSIGIDNNDLRDMLFLPMGRPDLIWTFYFPREFYREFVFLAFGLMIFCWNYILKNWLELDKEHRFWICLLFATMPANDARVVWAVFPYTVGLLLFSIACVHLSYMLFVKEKINTLGRLVNLLLFLCSFTLNSCLVYYAVVFLMLYKFNGEKLKIKKLGRYLDYLLVPVGYYLLKSLVFPPNGDYQGYNAVTMMSLLKAFVDTPLAVLFVMTDVFGNYFRMGQSNWFTLTVILIVAALIGNRENIKCILQNEKSIIKNQINSDLDNKIYSQIIIIAKYGLILLWLGLFAYVVIRHRYRIDTVGLAGRDSVLIGIGASMMVYALVRVCVYKRIVPYILSFIIMCGISFFLQSYQAYQLNYYKQQAFQHALKQNEQVLEAAKNIYVKDSNPDRYGFQSVYTLNANAELVFGKQDKFFFTSEKQMFSSWPRERLTLYHMKDYNSLNKGIDAVVCFSFDMTSKDFRKIKIDELQNRNDVLNDISKSVKVMVFTKEDDRFREILSNDGFSSEQILGNEIWGGMIR